MSLSMMLSGAAGTPPPPTPFLFDTFVATAGTQLSSHTPDTGGAWQNLGANILGQIYISPSGEIVYQSDIGSFNGDLNAASPPGTDYYVEAPLHQLSAAGTAGIALRIASATDFYGLIYDTGTPNLLMVKRISGSFTTIATYTLDLSGGDATIRLAVAGTSTSTRLTASINGSAQTPVDPGSTYLNAAGNAGVFMTGGTSGGPTTGVHALSITAA